MIAVRAPCFACFSVITGPRASDACNLCQTSADALTKTPNLKEQALRIKADILSRRAAFRVLPCSGASRAAAAVRPAAPRWATARAVEAAEAVAAPQQQQQSRDAAANLELHPEQHPAAIPRIPQKSEKMLTRPWASSVETRRPRRRRRRPSKWPSVASKNSCMASGAAQRRARNWRRAWSLASSCLYG